MPDAPQELVEVVLTTGAVVPWATWARPAVPVWHAEQFLVGQLVVTIAVICEE